MSARLSVCGSFYCWLARLQAISDPYSQTACLYLTLSAQECRTAVASIAGHAAYRLLLY